MRELIKLLLVGVDLTAEQRLWVRVAVLVGLIAAVASLHAADRWDVVEDYDLIGIAVALGTAILGLGQAAHRKASQRPASIVPRLTREETGEHLLARPPKLPAVLEELTEEDIDTERPPPVGPLDDDHDTDPQTPSAKRRQS